MRKTLDAEKVVHLLKGKRRYITILPYETYKKVEKLIEQSKPSAELFGIRYSESIVAELLNCFKGDVDKIFKFINDVEILRKTPFPDNCIGLGRNRYEVAIGEVLLLYHVNLNLKLVTILSVRSR